MTNDQDHLNLADLSSALPAATAGLTAEDRAGLVNVLKNKLEDLTGRHPDFLDTLSPSVKKRVAVLKDIQSQHDELEAKYFEEKAELEAKYQKLYEPLYIKRYEIVNGLVEVEGVSDDKSEDNKKDESTGDKGVPNFWLTAMKSNDVLADEISESDEGALQYLKDVKWCRIANAKGFKLEFFFHPNPYFKNSVLTKTYEMINEEEHILEKAIGTEIEWFPGKTLTQKVLRKKTKKGSRSPKPPIMKTEDCESFFHFFKPPQIPDNEDDIDEDTAELLQNQMEHDYDIGSTIRDKIIPHAVSWFTGEAAQNDEFEVEDEDEEDDDDDDDEEDDDEDDDDDDDEDDDDDDDDDVKHKKK